MEATGSPGIYWDDNRISYRTWVYVNGQSIFVGDFETVEEAERARDRFKRKCRIPPRPINRYEKHTSLHEQ